MFKCQSSVLRCRNRCLPQSFSARNRCWDTRRFPPRYPGDCRVFCGSTKDLACRNCCCKCFPIASRSHFNGCFGRFDCIFTCSCHLFISQTYNHCTCGTGNIIRNFCRYNKITITNCIHTVNADWGFFYGNSCGRNLSCCYCTRCCSRYTCFFTFSSCQ